MVSSNRVHGSCQKGHLEGRRWDGSSSVDKSTSRPELSGGNDVVLDLLVKRIAGLEMSTGRKGGGRRRREGVRRRNERTNERRRIAPKEAEETTRAQGAGKGKGGEADLWGGVLECCAASKGAGEGSSGNITRTRAPSLAWRAVRLKGICGPQCLCKVTLRLNA